LLKIHLNRPLALARTEDAPTVTFAHLQATAPAEDRLTLALNAALAGEDDLREADGATERLLSLLGLQTASPPSSGGQDHRAQSRRQRPGERRPGRDPIGAATAPAGRGQDEHAERATG
jgi:hypothetical protein